VGERRRDKVIGASGIRGEEEAEIGRTHTTFESNIKSYQRR
jgi:hypothetical protein